MRNFNLNTVHLSASIGLESAEIADAVDQTEDAILAAETTEEAAEIQSDVHTAESLEQRAIGLEDIADIVDENVGEATTGEVALVDIAQDLAATGIDGLEIEGTFDESAVPAGEAPALEHFRGTRISTESMRTAAADLWKAIQAIVTRIWDKMKELWRKFFDQAKSVAKAAKELDAKADAKMGAALKNKDKGSKIALGGLASTLMVNGTVPGSVAAISTDVEKLLGVSRKVLDSHAKVVIAAGAKLASAMPNELEKEPGNGALGYGQKLAKVAKEAKPIITSIKGLASESISGSDKRFESDTHTFTRSAYLPQNRMLVAELSKVSPDFKDAATLGDSVQIRSAKLELKIASDNAKVTGKQEITGMTPKEVKDAVKQILDLCDVVSGFNKDSLVKLEKSRDSLKSAGKAILGSISEDHLRQATTYANAIASYNTSYAGWCSSPFNSVTSLNLTTARALLSLGNKSLALYA